MYVESDGAFRNAYQDRTEYLVGEDALWDALAYWWRHPEVEGNRPAVKDFFSRVDTLINQYQDTLPVEAVDTVKNILFSGAHRDFRIDLPYQPAGWNEYEPHMIGWMGLAESICTRRLQFAQLYAEYPDLADYWADQRIIGFHGTGGVSLPAILKDGLVSHAELHERGETTMTGERFGMKRNHFVSFVEWHHADTVLETYAKKLGRISLHLLQESAANLTDGSGLYYWYERKRDEQQQTLARIRAGQLTQFEATALDDPFEVLIGLSARVFERRLSIPIEPSIKGEIGFAGWGVAPEQLPLILVPTRKVKVVQELLVGMQPHDPVRVDSIKALLP